MWKAIGLPQALGNKIINRDDTDSKSKERVWVKGLEEGRRGRPGRCLQHSKLKSLSGDVLDNPHLYIFICRTYLLSVLFCLLSMLISDSRFDLVWFRLSCDHGWIRSGSVNNVRKQQQQQQQQPVPFSSVHFVELYIMFCVLPHGAWRVRIMLYLQVQVPL